MKYPIGTTIDTVERREAGVNRIVEKRVSLSDVWVEGIPPYREYTEFAVRLKDGEIRTVRRNRALDHNTLFFTDCTHPLQNAYCADSEIISWRFA